MGLRYPPGPMGLGGRSYDVTHLPSLVRCPLAVYYRERRASGPLTETDPSTHDAPLTAWGRNRFS